MTVACFPLEDMLSYILTLTASSPLHACMFFSHTDISAVIQVYLENSEIEIFVSDLSESCPEKKEPKSTPKK